MTRKELCDWIAWDRISPFGQERDDWRTAWLIAHIVGIFTGKKTQVRQYLPSFGKVKKPRQTATQMRGVLMAASGAFEAIEKSKANRNRG